MAAGRKGSAARFQMPEVPLGVPTRCQSADEQQQLVRITRSPKVQGLRVVGVLLSLGAVMLAITWFLGFPYDPNSFLFEVLIVGILGAGLASSAAGIVHDPRSALARGETLDISGIVEPFGGRGRGVVVVSIGPLGIAVPRSVAGRLLPGQRHRLVLALATRRMPVLPLGLTTVAVLLSVDDVPTSSLARAFVARVDSGSAPLPYVASAVPVTFPGYPIGAAQAASVPLVQGTGPVVGAAHVFCPKCGYENAAESRFCPRCGTSVPVLAGPRPVPG